MTTQCVRKISIRNQLIKQTYCFLCKRGCILWLFLVSSKARSTSNHVPYWCYLRDWGDNQFYHDRTFLLIQRIQKNCIEFIVVAQEFTPYMSLAQLMLVNSSCKDFFQYFSCSGLCLHARTLCTVEKQYK